MRKTSVIPFLLSLTGSVFFVDCNAQDIKGGANSASSFTVHRGMLRNNGELNLSHEKHIDASVVNPVGSTLRIDDNQLEITGSVTNAGTMSIMDSDVVVGGDLEVSGALLYDPSTITVTTLTVSPNGYLAETGDPGDEFIISQDFINQSVRNTDWKTANTIFRFNGGTRTAANPQTIEAAGADLGAVSWAWVNNFSLGTLRVGTSQTYVKLVDDYGNSDTCLFTFCEISSAEALYVGSLVLEPGVTLDLNGFNLYVLGTVTDNGGTVLNGTVSVGTVGASGDINLSGEVNLADALLAQRHVFGIATLSPAEVARGDVYPQGTGDGQFNFSDLLGIMSFVLFQ